MLLRAIVMRAVLDERSCWLELKMAAVAAGEAAESL
jgi:hypothetical protein